MKLPKSVAAVVLTLVAMTGSAGSAAAGVFCGAGVITSMGTDVSSGSNATNMAFKLNNAAGTPGTLPAQAGANTATLNGSPGWMDVSWTNDTRFNMNVDLLTKAYLAGLTVRIWNNVGTDCAKMTDLTMNPQVCTSSSDCMSTGAP
jgi:hypothetical protein